MPIADEMISQFIFAQKYAQCVRISSRYSEDGADIAFSFTFDDTVGGPINYEGNIWTVTFSNLAIGHSIYFNNLHLVEETQNSDTQITVRFSDDIECAEHRDGHQIQFVLNKVAEPSAQERKIAEEIDIEAQSGVFAVQSEQWGKSYQVLIVKGVKLVHIKDHILPKSLLPYSGVLKAGAVVGTALLFRAVNNYYMTTTLQTGTSLEPSPSNLTFAPSCSM